MILAICATGVGLAGVFALWPFGKGRVTRIEGVLLIAAYVAHVAWIFTSA